MSDNRSLANTNDYVEAFRRNCPHARLAKDEWGELYRLFHVCIADNRKPPETNNG